MELGEDRRKATYEDGTPHEEIIQPDPHPSLPHPDPDPRPPMPPPEPSPDPKPLLGET